MSTLGALTDKAQRWWKKRSMKDRINRKVHALLLIAHPKIIEILTKKRGDFPGLTQKQAQRIAGDIEVWLHECVEVIW